MKIAATTCFGIALIVLFSMSARARADVYDFQTETRGEAAKMFSVIAGEWNMEQDGSNLVYAVDGRKLEERMISYGVPEKARELYGEKYAESLDRLESLEYFPLTLFKEVDTFQNGTISVAFKGISGKVDQAAGIAFDIKQNGDYLVIRANCLEDNLVLWKMERGTRTSVAWVKDVPMPSQQWHILKVVITGTGIEGYLDDKRYLEYTSEKPVSGKIGLWSKADSYVFFDNFTVIPAR